MRIRRIYGAIPINITSGGPPVSISSYLKGVCSSIQSVDVRNQGKSTG